MKRILVLIAVFVSLFFVDEVRADDDVDLIIEQELSLYDFSEWDYKDEDFSFNASQMIESYVMGENEADANSITDYVVASVKSLLLGRLPLILLLLAGAISTGLCSALIPGEKSELREIVSFIACVMCISVIVGIICDIVSSALQTIDRVSSFADAAMPVLSLIMVASGRSATEAVFSPFMVFLTDSVVGIVKTVIMPLIIIGFVLAIAGGITGKSSIGKLLGLTKSAAKWICGIMTTLFIGILSISGIGASAHDTLTMKTTKYVVDKAVPVAGGILSGTADTILECFCAIRAAAGVVFVVIAVIMVAKTLLRILCTNIALKVAAAVCEPIADERIPKLIGDVADVTKYLFAAVAVTDAMFIVSVALCTVVLG